jgi:capsular exopolysaccharide synthesis family protein
MSEAGTIRLVESTPEAPTGPPLQRAVLGTGHYLAEEFRFLAAKVGGLVNGRAAAVGIVSTAPEEGKTTVAIGLAAALARSLSQRVLLLEADLRQPSIERYLGLPRAAGVSEWLGGQSKEVPVRTVSPPGVAVITAGREPFTRPELLGSTRMAELIAAGRRSFGCVIVDCPPLDPVADAVALQDLVDGFLLVVRARRSSREAVERAVGRLKPNRIHGIVFNDQATLLPRPYEYRRSAAPHR